MSARIVTPTGEPAVPALNMSTIIKEARDKWSVGKKNEAFQTAIDGIELCSKGIARLMHDMTAMQGNMSDLQKKLDKKLDK